MTGAVPFKTAWMDPDHVRLASYRSPDDGTKVAQRGALPPFLDPWLGESIPEPLPGIPEQQPGQRGYGRHDDYAAHRCSCKHLVYADQVPGGSCRFCSCASHRPAGRAA
jgi:hypothetical protein